MNQSDSEKSFHLSNEDKEQQIQEPLIDTGRGVKKQKSQKSARGNEPYQRPILPATIPECQHQLQKFMDKYRVNYAISGNERGNRKSGDISDDQALEEEPDAADDGATQKKKQFVSNKAPVDAKGCKSVLTLEEFLQHHKHEASNPKKVFFDLSQQYYKEKYATYDKSGNLAKDANRRTLDVKSYIVTENHDNFIQDMQLDIINTNQGCHPIVKTFENDANNYNQQHHRWKKTLKFFDTRNGKSELKNQVIVDEGYKLEGYRTLDTSYIQFGNKILFYERKRDHNCHTLKQYDLINYDIKEVTGYEIYEPQSQETSYHIMFSQEFGFERNTIDAAAIQKKDVHSFLKDYFVIIQPYRYNERMRCVYSPFTLRSMGNMKTEYQQRQQNQYVAPTAEPVQSVIHIKNEQGQLQFIALDAFNCHYFQIEAGRQTYSPFTTYFGNNETQMKLRQILNQNEQNDGSKDYQYQQEQLSDWKHSKLDAQSISEIHKNNINGFAFRNFVFDQNTGHGRWAHDKRTQQMKINDLYVFNPFLKHQNQMFIIQKLDVVLNVIPNKNKKVTQYFYVTNDNEYMLLYPNYKNVEQKNEVISQIAKDQQYNRKFDKEFVHQDDYDVRTRDFRNQAYKKVSHICNEEYRNQNYIKKAEHLRQILNYERKFNVHDKIVLSSDQDRTMVYLFQSSHSSNKIVFYEYKNKVEWVQLAKHLPEQICSIQEDQDANFGPGEYTKKQCPPNSSFYINGVYRHVASNPYYIKTTMEPKNNDRDADDINYGTFKIKPDDKNYFMIVEGVADSGGEKRDGFYMTLRIKPKDFSVTTFWDDQNIRVEMYNKNDFYYTFFFSLVNENDKLDHKHTYFVVRKTIEEVRELGNDNNAPIIDKHTEVIIFKENDFKPLDVSVLDQYTESMSFQELIEHQMKPQQGNVHLTFEKVYDNRASIRFIPMIYQEKKSIQTHHFIVYDVELQRVVRHAKVISSLELRQVQRKNITGFVQYTLTRTSDVYNIKRGLFDKASFSESPVSQRAKYQLTSLFYTANVNEDKNLDQTQNQTLRFDEIDNQPENPAQSFTEMTEFMVNYSNFAKNSINIVGRKNLFLSQVAQQNREHSFENVLFTPYYNKKGSINGSRLILFKIFDKDESQVQYQNITLKDQEDNQVFSQQTDLVQFGHQKFLLNENCHDEYALVVAAQLRQKVILKSNLENSEAFFILSKVQRKLMSMQLAKFENLLLSDDFAACTREEFYQPQEVLEGKTINDLCLNFPKEVNQGLFQTPDQYKNIRGSLANEISEQNPKLLNNLLELGIADENLIIQADFNFCTTVRIAMELNSNQSVKVILEKVFELNNIKYQELLMLDLPVYLKKPRIERLYDFLERDNEELVQIEKLLKQSQIDGEKQFKHEYCNFEDFLNHPDLPPFAHDRVGYHVMERCQDYHNKEQEVIKQIVAKDPYMTWGVAGFQESAAVVHSKKEKNIEVEHSCIDFTKVIIGMKIRSVQEENYQKIEFSDMELASLMINDDDEYLEFYNLEVVRKIIDFQFTTVKTFMQSMFIAYSFGFMIPFLISLSVESITLLNICYTMCFATQLFFIMFELIQVKEQGKEYFMDMFNVIDSSQFIFFVLLYVSKMVTQFQSDTIFELFLQAFIIVQAFYKMIYYVRIYDKFLYLIQMSALVFKDVIPFISFLFIALLGFCKVFQVMQAGINDPENELSQIKSPMLQMMFQTYQATQGKKVAPVLSPSLSNRLSDDASTEVIMLLIVTVVWLASNSFFAFFGTTFMAQVYQGYEKYMPLMRMYGYRAKAKLNEENFQILDHFQKQRCFKIICFAMDKTLRGQNAQEYEGIVKTMNKNIEENANQEAETNEEMANIQHTCAEGHQKTQDLIDDMMRQNKFLADQVNILVEKLSQANDRRCHCERI